MYFIVDGVLVVFKKGVKKSEEISPQLSNKDKLAEVKKNNADKKQKNNLKHKKLIIISAISVIIILIIVLFLISYFDKMKYKPYVKYEEKMKTFGFDKLYNNQSAKTSDSVTKAEALKLAIAAVFNTNDISGIATEHNEYENAIWVEYAKDSEITKEDINSSNFNNKAKYIDVITYFETCKTKFLPDQEVKDSQVDLKDISKYTVEQQAAIKDMIANEVINLLSDKVNGNTNIFKGQLNELVVNFVEKYSTIAMLGEKLNVNPEKIPANAEEYPYTLSTIDKSVYEKPFSSTNNSEELSPKELYVYKKDYYPQIEARCEEFFNGLLNIDYKTITEESLRVKIEPYFIFKATDDAVQKYVQHVKENEIILEGSSQVQFPAVYFDGSAIRVRLKLKFEVKHSKTKDSLIYLDMLDSLKETYANNSYEILVDYYMSSAIGNNNLYINENRLYGAILDKENCGITKEIDKTMGTVKEGDVDVEN